MTSTTIRNDAQTVAVKANSFEAADFWHSMELTLGHPDALKRGCSGGWEDLPVRAYEAIQFPSLDRQIALRDLAHAVRRGLTHRSFMRQVNKG
jgi:hypothetical protein